MNPTPETVGDRLVIYREGKGWTGVELAKRSGVDGSRISEWERGRKNMALPSMRKIAATAQDPAAVLAYLINGGDLPPELVYGGKRGTPSIVREPPAPATPPDGDTRYAEGYRAGFADGFEKGRQVGGPPPDPARNSRLPNF